MKLIRYHLEERCYRYAQTLAPVQKRRRVLKCAIRAQRIYGRKLAKTNGCPCGMLVEKDWSGKTEVWESTDVDRSVQVIMGGNTGVRRDVLRWLVALNLSIPIKNIKRYFGSSFFILSCLCAWRKTFQIDFHCCKGTLYYKVQQRNM